MATGLDVTEVDDKMDKAEDYAKGGNPYTGGEASAITSAFEDAASSAEGSSPDYSDVSYDSGAVEGDINSLEGRRGGMSYLNDEGTVQGQLDKLLGSDSPLLHRAENKAATIAQRTGRAQSGNMSTAGALSAVYEAATPIAMKDAEITSSFLAREQEADYYTSKIQEEGIVSSAMNEAKAGFDAENQKVNNAFQARLQGANQAAQTVLTEQQAKWNHYTQSSMKELDSALQLKMQSNEISQQNYQTALSGASYIMQNAQTNLANMMTDPVLLDTDDPQTVANTMNNYISSVSSSMDLLGGLANAGSTFNTWSTAWKNSSWFNVNEVAITGTPQATASTKPSATPIGSAADKTRGTVGVTK